MADAQIAIFFDGTWANKNYRSWFGKSSPITAKNSIIAQLHSESNCTNSHYYPGPGTSNSYFSLNWLAGSVGSVGEYSVDANAQNALERILEHLIWMDNPTDTVDITICGWSRGAVTNFRLIDKLKGLEARYKNKIRAIYTYNIDPVPGGPSDRGSNITQLHDLSANDAFNNKVHSTTFYSDSGGIHLTHYVCERTPFFSALYDPTRNPVIYRFRANHEEIAGVRDTTGSSSIIKRYIKKTSEKRRFTYRVAANDNYVGAAPNTTRNNLRGFLYADTNRNSTSSLYFAGGNSLNKQEQAAIRSAQQCIDDAI